MSQEKAEKKSGQEAKAADKGKEKAKPKKKAKRRSVIEGCAYVNATYNNTIISLTEPNGNVIAWSSSGSSGFKGTRKATPYAAQTAAENAVQKSKVFGLEKVKVFVKGIGSGREQALRGLQSAGLTLLSITDTTPIPHNGCRVRKARRI